MANVRDDLNLLYKKLGRIDFIINILFYSNLSLSILYVILNNVFSNSVQGGYFYIISCLQFITAVLCFLLSVYSDYNVLYVAECERRKLAIQNGFSIQLSQYDTKGYYNNNFNPSIIKYSTNIFESVFFTRNICEKMDNRMLFKTLSCIVLILILYFLRDRWGLHLVVAQAIFSTTIAMSIWAFWLYKIRICAVFDKFYENFITIGINDDKQLNMLLYLSCEYEAIKAHYKVRLSTSIYNKYNAILTEEWDKMLSNISVNDRFVTK